MRKGLILGLLLILLSIAVIGGLLYRPATVIGTSGKSLAYSLRQEADSDAKAGCEGDDDEFSCAVASERGSPVRYRVDIDDYGCWDAERRRGPGSDLPDELSGCITIVDLVRLDD